jgi:hypothetical protein
MLEFEPIKIKNKDLMLVVDWDGNGYSGVYNPDPDEPESDSPLLRMTFFKRSYTVWNAIPYSRLQTYLIATDPRDQLTEAAEMLFKIVSKSNELELDPLYFKQLAYCHIFNGKPSVKIPLDTKDD